MACPMAAQAFPLRSDEQLFRAEDQVVEVERPARLLFGLVGLGDRVGQSEQPQAAFGGGQASRIGAS